MSAFGRCGGGGRRGFARQTGPLGAVVSTVTCSRSAVLLDVSRTGARVEGEDLPGPGDELFVTIEYVRAFGTVQWSHGGQVGIRFESPLDSEDVAVLSDRVARGGG